MPFHDTQQGDQLMLPFPSFFLSDQEVKGLHIPAANEARNLLISLNHRLGPCQVQEPKGHEPCGSLITAPQRLNLRPQLHSCLWLSPS
ncbi:hypothetical protein TB2_043862 [Malus domestica]